MSASQTEKNLNAIRNAKLPDFENFGQKLYEQLRAMITSAGNVMTQTNANGSSQPSSPPPLDGMKVTAQDGIFHISLMHRSDYYRGVNYHVEYSTSPNFTNPFPIHLGPSREWRGYLGNQTLHFQAAPSYGISPPSKWTVHGGATPIAVTGGGVSGPPLPAESQGSGTGAPGEVRQGPGVLPFRSKDGTAPVRG